MGWLVDTFGVGRRVKEETTSHGFPRCVPRTRMGGRRPLAALYTWKHDTPSEEHAECTCARAERSIKEGRQEVPKEGKVGVFGLRASRVPLLEQVQSDLPNC